MLATACSGPTFGDRIPHSGITSSSTTASASRRNGDHHLHHRRPRLHLSGANNIDYFELKTGASGPVARGPLASTTIGRRIISSVFGNSNAIEGTVGYACTAKRWNFFTPSISGTVGFQSYEKNAPDYTYWNAGLTLGFLDQWSADVRYYDTNYNARVLGTERRAE